MMTSIADTGQALCEHVIAAGRVCKPQSHTTLTGCLDGLNVEIRPSSDARANGEKRRPAASAQELPIRDGKKALKVNWCELITTDPDGKVLYHNAFVSNHAVSTDNVADMDRRGQCHSSTTAKQADE